MNTIRLTDKQLMTKFELHFITDHWDDIERPKRTKMFRNYAIG